MTDIDRFLEQLRSDAFDAANAPEEGDVRHLALVETALGRLEDSGVFDGCELAYFRSDTSAGHAEVHAYSVDTEDDVLCVFYLIDANSGDDFGSTWVPRMVAKEEVDRAFRRLDSFVRLASSGRFTNIEESQPAAELCALVLEAATRGQVILPTVIATGKVTERAALSEGRGGSRREVWDLVRLTRMCSGSGDEPLSIDFVTQFGGPLPCLVTPVAPDGIQVLLTSIPGNIVAEIYNTYRARLLERNVRSFLQFTGKVNKGIRDTLINSPSRFLPYNNGLSATASSVVLKEVSNGLAAIESVRDFQVVNGGQTTASIAAAARRQEADLGTVAVAMKLTIVPGARVDELVPLISKYANTQNRIQEADFSANHPWHIALERLSRESWTEPTADAPRGTRWYYERSRGQYADELSSARTPAGRRQFRTENPSRQKLTKTDLAKFILSWEQRPATVSRGAQRAFVEFMTQLSVSQRPLPEKNDLHGITSLAMLFHEAERICGELEFKGYRAQVVAYAIARLSRALERRVPLDVIWKTQAIPSALRQALKTVILGVRDVVTKPAGGRNVTEWTKREECWTAVLGVQLELDLADSAGWPLYAMFTWNNSTKAAAEGPLAEALREVPREVWYSVSAWAKRVGVLPHWQRKMAYSFGEWKAKGREFTSKQANQAGKIVIDAVEGGFLHPALTEDLVRRILAALDGK